MKKIMAKFNKEHGATVLDITTGALIFILFTSIIFTLYLLIYKQSSLIKIHQDAMGYMIQICEDIDMQDYIVTEDLEGYKNQIINKINLPEDRYTLTLQQEKYIDTHPEANDIVKKIIVNIKYTFDNEERDIEIAKIKVKEQWYKFY